MEGRGKGKGGNGKEGEGKVLAPPPNAENTRRL